MWVQGNQCKLGKIDEVAGAINGQVIPPTKVKVKPRCLFPKHWPFPFWALVLRLLVQAVAARE